MHILVTGGAGFIGSHLCERLVKDGHTVISLDNYFSGSRENHVAGVEYREGHTKDIEKLIPESLDRIYHLGEYSRVEQSMLEPDVVYDLNIEGTKGVVSFWQKQKCKLVYAGSSTKFGDSGWEKEAVPYVVTKAKNTEFIKAVGEKEELPYAITYFYNVYGPRERAGVYGTVIEAFKQMYSSGAPLTVTRPGTQVRNFTHVADIVEGLIVVGDKGQGDEYGLGNNTGFTVLEVAKMLTSDIIMLPERAGNRMSSALDSSKSRALGWAATHSLEEYLSDFVKSHNRGAAREKRILVFSTTFYPTIGPAEDALLRLMRDMPDVQFDIITTCFTKDAHRHATSLPNVEIHRVGVGYSFDKFLLPLLGFLKARKLSQHHRYVFAWSLMASYAAFAALFIKRYARLPLLITLADQRLERLSLFHRFFFTWLLSDADQVYGATPAQEAHAAHVTQRSLARSSLGEGDAFANQLRYSYTDTLLPLIGRKKILIFSLQYYPLVGGAEVAIKEITDRLPKEEYEFHMVALRFDSTLPKIEQVGNVLVHRIGFTRPKPTMADLKKAPLHFNKHWYQLAAANVAERLHRKHCYDGIWAMMAHSCAIPAGTFKTRHKHIPYVLTLQEGDPPEAIERLMKPVWSLFVRGFTSADTLQAISSFLLAWGKRMGFAGHSEIIPNAVDTKRFSAAQSAEDQERMRRTLGKKEGDVYVVTTSRLVHKNAVDDVIRALPHLPAHVSFLIYGIGPDEEKLRSLANELRVEDRARFMGQLSHEEMPLLLSVCDIFIRPSRSEGMGNSFIEAMAAGLPVIATQEGGIRDFLFDATRNTDKETTGWAVDRDAPEQIANAIMHILSHPDEVARVTATARSLAKEKYDWELISHNMKALFDRTFKAR